MYFRIDHNSGIPLGMQITRGIRLTIAQGRLKPGEQLPSARELSAQLKVNFHTVRKAYGDLQSEGVLEFHRGRGTFVSQSARRMKAAELTQLLREHARNIVQDLAGLDVDPKVIARTLIDEIAKALEKGEQL